ncbi:hypothetical protein J2X69_005180, partial [Algoriphagus sp. 4150]|uniref:condensation domain-containing protein n=1 Tax=Algoriphagus sp. 4150 TaxID=2817756 RepID=UPI002865C214
MRNKISNLYPANSLQQGFIYHSLTQTENDINILQQRYDYYQPLDVDKYVTAWQMCVAQYPILRTAFNWEEDVIQVIYQEGNLSYNFYDISELSAPDEKERSIDAIGLHDREKKFDLTKPTLFRLHVIKQAADCYTVIKTIHHIVTDGWSAPRLLNSVHEYYHELISNRMPVIKEDVAYLEAQEYISKAKKDTFDYWNKKLFDVDTSNDINPLLSRPMDLTTSHKVGQETAITMLEIEGKTYDALKMFSLSKGITLNVIVQFIWHKLLQVYSNSRYSVVGTTVSGRDLPIADIEHSVGLYINTLPLVIDWDNKNTIEYQLYRIQDQAVEMNTNSFADLAKLQKGGERLFHSLFVFESYPIPKESDYVLKFVAKNVSEKINYPLGVLAYEHNNVLSIYLHYDGYYLNEEKARAHMGMLDLLLKEVLAHPEK